MRKEVSVDFTDFVGGINLVDSPINFDKNMVQDGSIDGMFTRKGARRRPGCVGIAAAATFSAYLRLLEIYRQLDGTEKLIALSGGKIYSVSKTTEELTELLNITGTGEGVGASYMDKFWLCNGTDVAKIENGTAYKVGIVPPTGATATGADTGGTLPSGVYKIYVSYYRKVSSDIVLYSVGQSIADVTLGAGNTGKISFVVADSTDAQVGGVAVWMTDAGGTNYYRYHTADGSGAYSFDVTSNANKNASELYTVKAQANQRPPAFTYLAFAARRMWGVNPSTKNRVHYSIKASTVYDLERFPNITGYTNWIDFPYEVTGLFELAGNLFINTLGGIYALPAADPSVEPQLIDKRYYFRFMGTVAYWGTKVIGLTNNGVRIFDGYSFTDDLSKLIRPVIDKCYSATANHLPRGLVYDRVNHRMEYHLTYQDTDVGTATANRRMVLNLSELAFYQGGKVVAPWELWSNGANYLCSDQSGVFFQGQSHATASKIFKETTTASSDCYMYSSAGAYLSTATAFKFSVLSSVVIPSLNMRVVYNTVRAIMRSSSQMSLTVQVSDRYGVSDTVSTGADKGSAQWDVSEWDVDVWPVDQDELIRKRLKRSVKGYGVFVKLVQEKDDLTLNVLKIVVQGVGHVSRYT